MNRIEMYAEFRKELERFSIPLVLSHRDMKVHDIECEGKVVGIFCVVGSYIDCIYILPEYRCRGLAKDIVLKWAKGNRNIKLHIINNNEAAKAFWNSVFELKEIDVGDIDTLYRAVKIKGDGDV